ncbi:MAG: hypothetical protein FI719_07225 [SAR202 cluster bacterium]|nr:hypothetical protein [SAR202 cluster bacterium]|tara:strand:+ start:721 stop:1296 length:576 start_codon:yes stop_codon:yes gene_type:complete
MNVQPLNYFQQVKASGRTIAFLGLLLGLTAGVFTGVGIKHLVGDPLVSGLESLLFYGAFGGSSLITLFVMLNYLMMSLRVSGEGIAIQRGMKSAMLNVDVILTVRVAETRSRMSRAASEATKSGRQVSQMWSVMGIGSGVEIDLLGSDNQEIQTWFISSNDPSDLCEKLQLVISHFHGDEELEDRSVSDQV